MSIATFWSTETNSQVLRLTNYKPLNKYFWEKEKAVALDKICKERGYDKEKIIVKDL